MQHLLKVFCVEGTAFPEMRYIKPSPFTMLNFQESTYAFISQLFCHLVFEFVIFQN
jgi:hypothetical protein